MKLLLASFGVVLHKELVDGVRDRRSIVSALVPLAIIPLFVLIGFNAASDQIDRAKRIEVPVVGAEHARALIDWLAQQSGVEIQPGGMQPRIDVREGRSDFVLVIPEHFAERFAQAKTAEVQIVVDSSDPGAERAAGRLRRLIRLYGQQIQQQRLIARGVSPEVIQPLRIETIELATRRERMAMAFAFVPMLLLITVFVGGLQIAIDSTAGERERGSLEPLLVNPVPRFSIVGGKWVASVAFSWVSLALTMAMLVLVLERTPLQRLGLNLEMGPVECGRMFAVILPLSLLASAVEMCIATLSRSYKEAQTYVSFLMFAPTLPLLLTLGSSNEPALWKLAVPVLGQQVLITNILEGGAFDLVSFLVAALVALAGAIVFLGLTARLFRRERIVFGR